jgi:hypothetical protein
VYSLLAGDQLSNDGRYSHSAKQARRDFFPTIDFELLSPVEAAAIHCATQRKTPGAMRGAVRDAARDAARAAKRDALSCL